MIEFVPLFTMTLSLATSLNVGAGPTGSRFVGAIREANVAGERFNASLAGPAAGDWMITNGAVGVIDARLTLRTHDDALIFMSYGGRLDMTSPATGMFAYAAPVFETGDPRYAWLNAVQAAGKGQLTLDADGGTLAYQFFEIR
jgi:hypothetical protein